MKDWKQTLIFPHTTIREALRTIDQGSLQVALIVDDDMKLLGVVTDGDIRRGILNDIALDSPVSQIMNRAPISVPHSAGKEALLKLMNERSVHHIPKVDEAGRVVGLATLEGLLAPEPKSNPVILMVGGRGTRLRPLTNDCPKPLLKVGDRPILETVLVSLVEQGFQRFFLAVNYLGHMIESYFGDGKQWGVEISYLKESKPLGTAGALSLVAETFEDSILIMNGDLLTKLDFSNLLEFHKNHQAEATMGVREYDHQVPYGVVEADQHRIVDLVEKPIYRFFVNAGVYVLEPHLIHRIPPDTFYDMPELFKEIVDQQGNTAVFPIREYWMDIGQLSDYRQANTEYKQFFQ